MLLPRGRALNSADSMNNKIIALVSIGVAAITFMSCKCAWAGSAQELTVTPTAKTRTHPSLCARHRARLARLNDSIRRWMRFWPRTPSSRSLPRDLTGPKGQYGCPVIISSSPTCHRTRFSNGTRAVVFLFFCDRAATPARSRAAANPARTDSLATSKAGLSLASRATGAWGAGRMANLSPKSGAFRAQSTFRSIRSVIDFMNCRAIAKVWLCCGVGQRAHYATYTLLQNGFRVRNLPGGFPAYQLTAGDDPAFETSCGLRPAVSE